MQLGASVSPNEHQSSDHRSDASETAYEASHHDEPPELVQHAVHQLEAALDEQNGKNGPALAELIRNRADEGQAKDPSEVEDKESAGSDIGGLDAGLALDEIVVTRDVVEQRQQPVA